jgi:TPR repeat protein
LKHFIVAAVLAVVPMTLTAQNFDKGLEAYEAGDYQTALKYFKDIASGPPYEYEYGSVVSCEGELYSVFCGYRPVYPSDLFPSDQAETYLAQMYLNGMGVLQDYAEAVKWYRLAAEQGNPNAQFNLGRM